MTPFNAVFPIPQLFVGPKSGAIGGGGVECSYEVPQSLYFSEQPPPDHSEGPS